MWRSGTLCYSAATDLPEPVRSPGAELKRMEEEVEEEEEEVSHGSRGTHSNVTQAAHMLIRLMAKIILLEHQVTLKVLLWANLPSIGQDGGMIAKVIFRLTAGYLPLGDQVYTNLNNHTKESKRGYYPALICFYVSPVKAKKHWHQFKQFFYFH